MKAALAETTRRRRIQEEFNRANGITPQSIIKRIDEVLTSVYERDYMDYTRVAEDEEIYLSPLKRKQKIDQLEKGMREAAKNLEFEKAAKLRDEIARLKKFELELE
jgi:excinuclease ABC subunit B